MIKISELLMSSEENNSRSEEEIRLVIRTPTSTSRGESRPTDFNDHISYTETIGYFLYPYFEEDDNSLRSMTSPWSEFSHFSSEQIANFIRESMNSGELKRNDQVKLCVKKEKYKLERLGDDTEKFPDCTICQSGYDSSQYFTKLSCEHIFHYDCIINWGKYKQCCPLCRKEIPYRTD